MAEGVSRSFIRDNVVVLAGNILVYTQGIILMPLIIKSVGDRMYGGFVVLTSILSVVNGLSSLGIGFTASRLLPATQQFEERRRLFMPQFAFHLASITTLSLLLMASNDMLRRYLLTEDLVYTPWVIPAFLVSYVIYTQATNYFRYTSRLATMTIAGVLYPMLNIVIVLATVGLLHTITINLLILAQTGAAIAVAIPLYRTIRREIGIRLTFGDRKTLVADLRVGFPLALNFIVDFLLAASDRWIISMFMGVEAVASYYPAYVLGSLVMLVPRAMSGTLPQLCSKAVDGGRPEEAHRMIDYAIKIYLLVAVPFVVGCATVGHPLLALLGNHTTANSGYLVVPVVATGTVFFGLTLLLCTVFFVRRNTTAIFRMNAIAAAVNVLWNLLLLAVIKNIMVAAWSTLVSYVVAFAYIRFVLKDDWPILWNLPSVVRSVIASLVMGVVVMTLRALFADQSIQVVALEISVGMAVYAAVLFAIGGVSPREAAFMKAQLARLGLR